MKIAFVTPKGRLIMNIVITGASRGIGLALTAQALSQSNHVMAFARSPQEASELKALKEKFGNQLEIKELDVNHARAPENAAEALSSWQCVDILFNNAGISREGESLEDFMDSFRVNSVAPFLITRSLFPKLKAASDPKSIQTSSLMGSIEDNKTGGRYTYRASKAALNMITKTLAESEKWLIAVVMHPGWVKTRMGGSEAPVLPADSARGIWRVVQELGLKESGDFYDYEGNRLHW
jgi:NAD(P)-dependent dehydrogenase (short-subunit alcohol dehydrogenase family)